MSHPRIKEMGFTLFELLVVVVIVGILALASVAYVQDRHSSAVRGIVDELEGQLVAAQTKSQLTLGDVVIHTEGTWTGVGDGGTMVLVSSSNAIPFTAAAGHSSEAFRSHYLDRQRDHVEAGVGTGREWYIAALGGAPSLHTVSPCKDAPFISAFNTPLFTGAVNETITINGNSKRFTTGFFIAVVGLRADAGGAHTYPGAPIAVLVVPSNGTGVYKFYKGPDELSWRRM